MAKRKKLKIQPSVIKSALLGLFTLAVGFLIFKGSYHLLTRSEYFTVETIDIDSSLQFINERDLARLKGKNIFTVDLKGIQRNLGFKYPQVSQLKIARRFPNQILVEAKKRLPFAQTNIKNRTIILDEKGVVLFSSGKLDSQLPFIEGLKSYKKEITPGLPLGGKDIYIALRIIKYFQANRALSPYSITTINIENLSKIYFYMSNKLKIIIDREAIDQKLNILSFVLSQDQLDLKRIKYIDLRFQEPIIGKK